MDWLTPTFLLQVILTVGSVGTMYGALRQDFRHMAERIAEETRQRELLDKYVHDSVHKVLNAVHRIDIALAGIEKPAYNKGDKP